jgi:mono/diheme cytochrome c family protein
MQKAWTGALLAFGFFVLVTRLDGRRATAQITANAPTNDPTRVALEERRNSELDLEIGGELAGVPHGTTRYIWREELLKLPQVTYRVSDDANFKGPVEISGVLLEQLSRSLGASSAANLVVAICDDQYRANYPQEYLRAHHPVLVLKIDGKAPSEWPTDGEGHGAYMGPFLVSHAKFAPSFKIFAHQDQPQIPWGVTRLEFRDQQKVFAAIAPRGPHADDAEVQAGFRIAQQNCFRCHNLGEEGGKKSGRPWLVLAAWAAAGPERFFSYVKDPRANNPNTQMEASPQYDHATMQALIAYFRTFMSQERP